MNPVAFTYCNPESNLKIFSFKSFDEAVADAMASNSESAPPGKAKRGKDAPADLLLLAV